MILLVLVCMYDVNMKNCTYMRHNVPTFVNITLFVWLKQMRVCNFFAMMLAQNLSVVIVPHAAICSPHLCIASPLVIVLAKYFSFVIWVGLVSISAGSHLPFVLYIKCMPQCWSDMACRFACVFCSWIVAVLDVWIQCIVFWSFSW